MNDFHSEEQQHPPQPPPAASEKSETSESTKPLSVKASQELNFMDKVKNYVKENRTRVYILTPCYGSLCYVNYVLCLQSTFDLFRSVGIEHKVEFCRNDSLVSRARNNLVAKAMNDPLMTHILFIDADITWEPADVLKLIICNKSLCGGVYPVVVWAVLCAGDLVIPARPRRRAAVSDYRMVDLLVPANLRPDPPFTDCAFARGRGVDPLADLGLYDDGHIDRAGRDVGASLPAQVPWVKLCVLSDRAGHDGARCFDRPWHLAFGQQRLWHHAALVHHRLCHPCGLYLPLCLFGDAGDLKPL